MRGDVCGFCLLFPTTKIFFLFELHTLYVCWLILLRRFQNYNDITDCDKRVFSFIYYFVNIYFDLRTYVANVPIWLLANGYTPSREPCTYGSLWPNDSWFGFVTQKHFIVYNIFLWLCKIGLALCVFGIFFVVSSHRNNIHNHMTWEQKDSFIAFECSISIVSLSINSCLSLWKRLNFEIFKVSARYIKMAPPSADRMQSDTWCGFMIE